MVIFISFLLRRLHNLFYSTFSFKISRESIDALKGWFRDEMQKPDWQLTIELKKLFEIM